MKSTPKASEPTNLKGAILCAVSLFLSTYLGVALAGTTDISNVPLASDNPAQAKPNIMLLMDTSGSMGWTHMPDILEGSLAAGVKYIGYKSPHCNALYYNPATNYELPKQADSSFMPTPSFTAARYDAYDTASTTLVDLSTSFKAYDDFTLGYSDRINPGQAPFNDTAQPAYYYLHSSGVNKTPGLAPCTDADTGAVSSPASGGGTWNKVVVSATSGPGASDERQNFANWYTYYRTRMSLVKSAASLAFNALTDSFRVGFITVQPKDLPTDAGINAAKYLPIADFDTTQRSAWYAKLFSQKPGGASPAREGLARVGRHYAGKQDGINTNMTGDPLQYYCQQNFTIMTTDGYWNDQTETPNRGPVQIDGVTRVGQQDGTLTDNAGWSPRPIWEGFADGTRVTTDKSNLYYFSTCVSGWYNQSTSQILASTVQTLQSTTQTQQSTAQTLQSTAQDLRSTVQNLQSTTQVRESTTQPRQSTTQNLQSTTQNLQSTTQNLQSTTQPRQSTTQNLRSTTQNVQNTSQNIATTTQNLATVTIARQSTTQNLRSTTQVRQSTTQVRQSTLQNRQSTVQNLRSTTQNVMSTTQVRQSTLQNRQSTVQNLRSTTQNLQSTTQNLQSTVQNRQSTVQNLRSTTQNLQSTVQYLRSTSQIRWYNPSTELWDPVQTCPNGGTCQTVTTTNVPVATCTAASASAGNSWTATTCSTNSTSNVPVQTCTAASATSGNNFTTTTCSTNNTSNVPVQTCTAASATSGNSWTTTNCSTNSTSNVPVQTCTASAATSGNNWTTTTCNQATTGPTAVETCTAVAATSGNNWTATTCSTNNTSNVPVQTCTASGPNSGNNYTTTTCPAQVVTTNVPVQTCTAAAASSGNSWTTTTCSTNNTTNVPVQTCTASSATSGNNWTTTTCSPLTTGPTAVQTCTPVTATAGNNWTATTCSNNNQTNVPVQTCTASAATSGNSWTTTTCPAPIVTTNVPVQTCTSSAAASGNNWTTTTCSTNNTTNVPVQTCTASSATSGNNWTTTTCSPLTTGPTAVQTCTPVTATSGNNWTATTCANNNTGPTAVQTCTASAATSGNSWTTTTCANNNTGPTAVQTCTPSSATSGNSWTTTTCSTNNTSNIAVASCTPATASSGNSWTTTTCSTQTVSGPTPVQTCTPVTPTAGNGFQRTTCSVATNSTPVQTCTPVAASAGNNWTATTCSVNTTTNVPVQTCTPATASAGNNWTTVTCPAPIVTTNVPVQTCTASAATSGNNWTAATCSTNNTTNVPVQTCTASSATSGNNWVTTTCNPLNTGPTPVQTCAASAGTAGNNWVTTTCSNNNTSNVPVATCTAATASAGNNWTTVTCPAPVVTTNVPVQTCTAAAAASGNSWTTTTCSTNNTTNVPVQTCTASSATSGNNWVTTTCNPLSTGPTPVQTCTASAGTAVNNWVTTSCSNNNTTNVPVETCIASGASSGNNWTTTSCPPPVVTTNVPVQTCTGATAASGNNWTTTTCSTNNTSNVPVQTCTAAAESAGNNWTTTTCTPNNSGPTPVQTCTTVAASAGNNWTATSCTPNNTTNVPVQNCAESLPSAVNNWTTTTCTPNNTTNVPSASCTAGTAGAGNGWTTTTCNTVVTPDIFTNSCTPVSASAGNSWTATMCTPVAGEKAQYRTTTTTTETLLSGGVVIPGITPVVTTTQGAPVDLDGVCYLAGTPAGAAPALPSPNPQAPDLVIAPWPTVVTPLPSGCSGWPCSVTNANTGGSINSLADVAQYYYVTDLRPESDWPANIALNDLKAVGTGPESDRATHQHMTTFSVALGVSGTLVYDSNYKKASTTTGDFAMIRSGTKNWPLWPDPTKQVPAGAGPTAWDATAQTYTDKNYWNDPRSIDDFWHAAVNGRGQYFSAGTPKEVVSGLTGALSGIQSNLAAGAAAGASSLQPVPGDNFFYVASYITKKWIGDVQAKEMDVATGALGSGLWSAQAKIDAQTKASCDNRSIYLVREGATNNLVNFTWNSYACASDGSPTGTASTGLNASEQQQFNSTKVSLMSQFSTMTDGTNGTVDQKTPAAGANLVNFLRGQRGKEGYESNGPDKLYRARDNVLGDVVNSQPVYVKAPIFGYLDAGYDQFKLDQQSRTPMVYFGANDGMLHAVYANVYQSGTTLDPQGGKEAWAIVPSMVLPNLYKLADNNYANTHTYSVDGTPVIGDVDVAAPHGGTPAPNWKTILVAGLNAGGKGYYALDVTDPATPKALWEFKWSSSCWNGVASGVKADCHVGYTFGKPVITKLATGKWVVLVTSGYNNINAPTQSGDGLGYLYVLDAGTGEIIYKIATSAGSATTPSGLAQITNYVDNVAADNTTSRVYGGDVLGNIWRFDINDVIAPLDADDGAGNGREAILVGTAKDSAGIAQPITTRPELAELDGKTRVFVGTGRLLGASDLDPALASTTQTQSVYGFIDPVLPPDPLNPMNTVYSDLRGVLRPLTITQSGSGASVIRTVACSGNSTECARSTGWVVDLPDSRERVNVDLKLVFGTLVFASNVPQNTACSFGGYSWLNYLNFADGLAVPQVPNSRVSTRMQDSIIVGLNIALTGSGSSGGSGGSGGSGTGTTGNGTPTGLICTSDGTCTPKGIPTYTVPSPGKRVSWREVVNTQ